MIEHILLLILVITHFYHSPFKFTYCNLITLNLSPQSITEHLLILESLLGYRIFLHHLIERPTEFLDPFDKLLVLLLNVPGGMTGHEALF